MRGRSSFAKIGVTAMRSTGDSFGFKHLENSPRVVRLKEDKAALFDLC